MEKVSKTTEPKEYRTGGWAAHWILFVCTMLVIVCKMDQSVLSAVLQPMKQELGLSDAEAGSLATIMLLSIAVFASPLGFLMDRWSRKKSIALMAMVWSVATVMSGFAKNFLGAVIPRFLVGVGESAYIPGGTAIISAAYSQEKRARVLSIFSIGSALGLALGMITGGVIAARMGWHYAFFILGLPGILFGFLALFMRDYKTVRTEDESGRTEGFFQAIFNVLKIRTLPWFWAGWILAGIVQSGLMTWISTYMMRSMEMKVDRAGSIMSLIMVIGLIGVPVGGWLSDSWQKKRNNGRLLFVAITFSASAFLAIPMVLAAVPGKVGMFLTFGIFFMLVQSLGQSSLWAIAQDVAPPAYKVLVVSLGYFLGSICGGAWWPWAMGAISDALGGGAFGLKISLLITCFLGMLSFIFFLISSRYYFADAEKSRLMVLESEK